MSKMISQFRWLHLKNLTIEDQIKKECRMRDLPEPIVLERLESITVNGRERTPIHFHRFRSKRGLTQPDTHGSFWKLTFPKPVSGPLALGFGCHYGLGMFKAVTVQGPETYKGKRPLTDDFIEKAKRDGRE